MRLYKPKHVGSLKPEAIILGSSRTGTIRPQHPAWDDLVAYNLSVPGMTITELSTLVKHAHAIQPLSKLMIGLDFQAVISPLPVYRAGFEPARLIDDSTDFYSPRYIQQELHDLRATLFSFDIFGQSVTALAGVDRHVREFYPDGAWASTSNRLKGRGGYVYVAQSTANLDPSMVFGNEENLRIFRDLLDFCYRHNIDTRIFFTPTHVFFVDLWFNLTSEQLWRSTHREIIAINAEVAEKYGKPAFRVWGFGNEKQVTAEPIVSARDIDSAWFDDGVHYGTKLGNRIMAAMWDPANNFGQLLTPATVENYLNDINLIRQAFVQSNQQLVEDMYREIELQP
jgi:hypothetical protein